MSVGKETGVRYPGQLQNLGIPTTWQGPTPTTYQSGDGDGLVKPTVPAPSGGGTVTGVPTASGTQRERIYMTRESSTAGEVITVKQVADDADGHLDTGGGSGTVNYATGVVRFRPTDTYKSEKWSDSSSGGTGTWTEEELTDTWGAGSLVRIAYRPASVTPTVRTENFALENIVIDLAPYTGDQVVPNSVQFQLGATVYLDRNGVIYRNVDPVTGAGTEAGVIDYVTGRAVLTDWVPGSATFTLQALLTRRGLWVGTDASFRTALSPVKPEALSITAVAVDGEVLTGAADEDGVIVGTDMRGTFNYEFGTAEVEFGEEIATVWTPRRVDPTTIRYNAVAYKYLPLDAEILGVDAVRLPSDGRVPIYRPGDVAVIMHTAETVPVTISGGDTIDCGRTRLGWVRVIDANGDTVPDGFELNRATGILTFPSVAGIDMPISVRHTVADLRQITDVQITGELTFARPLSHTFPLGSIVSSCLLHGDRRARVSLVFDQQTWTGVWSDTVIGSEATATLDVIAHPIVVTNEGTETEKWFLRFITGGNVELIGQTRGLVYSGAFTSDIAPINPRTRNPDGTGGVPYLTIPVAANGGGWSTGNVVRINTVGALADIWIARAISQSDEPAGDGEDGCELYCLGNVDRP